LKLIVSLFTLESMEGPLNLKEIIDRLVAELEPLKFGPPISHVYNPMAYARVPYDLYVARYGHPPKEVLLVGMNPGPWGMAQTGIPFGEVRTVKEWLGIEGPVGQPPEIHPRRAVDGFACKRSEVSGKRLWGWAQKRFKTPERFFSRFFVANYCPLLFIEEDGRNRTPDRLRGHEKEPLLAVCDWALKRTVEYLKPSLVVGVGRFSAERCRQALYGMKVQVGGITHPSPANPKANRNWEKVIERELKALGLRI
jgi:single-strand selective monofunctional uracil DNA glycosylase